MKKSKKTILCMLSVATIAAFTMTSCDKSSSKMDEKTPAATAKTPSAEGQQYSENISRQATAVASSSQQLPTEGSAKCLYT